MDDNVTDYEYFQLIDYLIKDIQQLEAEVVKTRYELSNYLEQPHRDYLRCNVLSGLAGRYSTHSAYEQYIKEFCHNSVIIRIQWNLINGLIL